ncbi:hypothetical protein Vadar_017575 [Vaccinium darrowii]|uniref:Uncharacterized protein n=1 Tax=Vaccinium darrowii TaxID=229202 RepID=A0ACB7YW37_9ERIC|nr:hypothetical protein Vadar_017575 [Vaccinium darrowii]
MVMGKKVSYEEIRRQRVEENKKKMEELHLPLLSVSLKKQPSPVKRARPRVIGKELIAVRRSNRISNQPAPGYREIVTLVRTEHPRRNRNDICKMELRNLSNSVYASDEARDWAIARAEVLESGLEVGYPTVVKPITQSHESRLSLPRNFGHRNLPRLNETVTLVDEEGEQYPVVYLAGRSVLSGGWKRFAIAHGLVDGDALVFQLISPSELKVYIIRAANCIKEGENL